MKNIKTAESLGTVTHNTSIKRIHKGKDTMD